MLRAGAVCCCSPRVLLCSLFAALHFYPLFVVSWGKNGMRCEAGGGEGLGWAAAGAPKAPGWDLRGAHVPRWGSKAEDLAQGLCRDRSRACHAQTLEAEGILQLGPQLLLADNFNLPTCCFSHWEPSQKFVSVFI